MLVERFGAGPFAGELDFAEWNKIAEVLHVIEVFRLAGTEQQNRLSPGAWETVVKLNALAKKEKAQ